MTSRTANLSGGGLNPNALVRARGFAEIDNNTLGKQVVEEAFQTVPESGLAVDLPGQEFVEDSRNKRLLVPYPENAA